jgi:hypothetical protein
MSSFIEGGLGLVRHVFVWGRVCIVSGLEGLSKFVSLVLIGFKSVNMTVVSLGYRCSFGK